MLWKWSVCCAADNLYSSIVCSATYRPDLVWINCGIFTATLSLIHNFQSTQGSLARLNIAITFGIYNSMAVCSTQSEELIDYGFSIPDTTILVWTLAIKHLPTSPHRSSSLLTHTGTVSGEEPIYDPLSPSTFQKWASLAQMHQRNFKLNYAKLSFLPQTF